MTIPFSAKVAVPADVLMRDLGGEAVILNLKSEMYFGLDEVGTRMWAVLTTAPSIEAAFETLRVEYDVAPEKLRGDLEALVGQLLEKGLLEQVDGETTPG
jgi:hypothetical protein